ncbi:MAG: hypothetical protein FD175_1680 [Beijerinckiaceae bacterium]|nr:MAG: hypothetical protein FD175_1680 [Beijerinckiaceae bacterium]
MIRHLPGRSQRGQALGDATGGNEDRMTDGTGGRNAAKLDEASVLARFVPDTSDAVGHVAYALHRGALMAFRQEFHARHARSPDAVEEEAFLVGEVSDARIAAYRTSASGIVMPAAASGTPKRKARWPWFGMWIDAPMAPSGQPEAINWRGLFTRLIVLLLAVITTAILLRVLFVKS